MIALIDGDLIAYRTAASCKEDDPAEVAFQRAEQLIKDILEAVNADHYQLWLSGSENFRKVINSEYKANRKDQVPPQWLQDTREFLVAEWNAKLSHGREADDELGINQTMATTVICSLDKDLKMIPYNHYSWGISGTKPNGEQWIKEAITLQQFKADADNHFWKQMLIGDRTDNIFGVSGIGEVKANKLVYSCEDNQDCLEVILAKYDEDYKRFAMNATCLWIMRGEGSTWYHDLNLTLPSQLQQEVEAHTECMRSLMDAT